ncbi:MAG: type II toxin-antitoxin system HipA family toxin [Gammaproteobacteria bacterium]|nr:type II toxin-antitoxin system HipA family toxin [Gammaproteobacteria bacterium]
MTEKIHKGNVVINYFDNLLPDRIDIRQRIQARFSVYLFWVLGAIDGHAKNFSIFLHPHGQFKLAPLYDVISAYPLAAARQIDKRKLCMAMRLQSKNSHSRWWSIMPRHWFAMAEKVNFPQEQMSVIIDEIRETLCQAIDKAVACLPAGFPETISVPIINGIDEAVTRTGSFG